MRRRRILRLLAVAGGLAVLPGHRAPGLPPHLRWRGSALGAESRIDLWLDDPALARQLILRCVAEIDRLERIFSLQRADSALAALNRDGQLRQPPAELVTVLQAAQRMAGLSGGAFDVTVQPLWRLYADHYADPAGDAAGPPPRALAAVGRLVGAEGVEVARNRVRLARPGMALTLNGIAQGFIADRVAELVRAAGEVSTFLDVGEVATVGHAPTGGGWLVQARAGGALLDLAGGLAVATSSPRSLSFDPAGRRSHLLEPATLAPTASTAEVTVVADSAMVADMASTAWCIRPGCLPADHRLPIRQLIGEPAAGTLLRS